MRDHDSDAPFRLLVMADLSGRGHRGDAAGSRDLGQRRVRLVDRDNFEVLLAELAPSLRLTVPGAGAVELRFRSLEDFAPAALCAQLPVAQQLRALRDRLADPARFGQALAEARQLLGAVAEPAAAPRPAPAPLPDPARSANLLEQMLDAPPSVVSAGEALDAALLREIEPELLRVTLPGKPAGQEVWVAAAEAALARVLRGVLHDPAFQALEAAWRSVFLLVRRIETGQSLTLSLLDLSRAELVQDVGVSGPVTGSGLHRLLVEQTVHTPGGQPWSVVVLDQAFGPSPRDVATLLRVTRIVHAGGAALAAGAEAGLFGCTSLGATPEPADWNAPVDAEALALWERLRQVPEAGSTALVWPRVLLRAPYGAASDPVEEFAFEELAAFRHEHLVWGNGAFVLAHALAAAFARAGWDLRDELVADLTDLPGYVHSVDGESVLQPCAEAVLTTTGAEVIRARGVIPLLSVRGAASVRLGGLSSLAQPESELQGPWQ